MFWVPSGTLQNTVNKCRLFGCCNQRQNANNKGWPVTCDQVISCFKQWLVHKFMNHPPFYLIFMRHTLSFALCSCHTIILCHMCNRLLLTILCSTANAVLWQPCQYKPHHYILKTSHLTIHIFSRCGKLNQWTMEIKSFTIKLFVFILSSVWNVAQ